MTPQIMIVEDEFLIAMEMEQLVGNLGYDCIGVADDTESAIGLVSKKPNIALVDVNLSDGPTGPAIGARLANEHDIKVVFVTANPKQLGAGVKGTLGAITKPIEIEVLKGILDYLVKVANNKDDVEPPRRMKLFERSVS
jgi:CheY-like chemotaxis protein